MSTQVRILGPAIRDASQASRPVALNSSVVRT
jgi:hypothetical protein